MPPPYVRTVREELLYEYAKLISRSAYGSLERAFITDRFKNFGIMKSAYRIQCASGNVSKNFREPAFTAVRQKTLHLTI